MSTLPRNPGGAVPGPGASAPGPAGPADGAGPGGLTARGRRWLAWSAPVVLALLLAGAVLIGVGLGAVHARSAYDGGRPDEAATRYAHQKTFPVEPWKAWFNTGTALLRAGHHRPATAELTGALDRVPAGTADGEGRPDPAAPECRVRHNLSLALEGQGDAAATAGDDAAALGLYEDAMDAVGPCTADGESGTRTPPDPPADPSAQDEAEARQREKADDVEQSAPGEQAPPEEPAEEPEPQPEPDAPAEETPDDPRQRELEERNRSAQQDRQEQEQRSGGGTGGGRRW